MDIQLSDHFNYRRLLRFTLPSIAMMLFTSVYGIVDGYFVSNFVGKTEFAALNLIWPLPMVLGSLGFMFGTGGTALVSKTMGEGDYAKASRQFSMIVWFALALGVVLAAAGMFFIRPVAALMGAEGKLLEDATLYGSIIMAALPTFIMQCAFQPFMVSAERPRLGFWITFASGMTNIVLDVLFIGLFRWGLVGAASATAASQVVGFVCPMVYFLSRPKPGSSPIEDSFLQGDGDCPLRLGKPSWDGIAMLKCCSNGMSEFVTNVSMSFVGMLYNARLLEMAGENGVAAYGFIMYVNLIFIAVYIGYAMGVAPVISFHFGAKNYSEVRNLRSRSMRLLSVSAVLLTSAAILSSRPLASLFVGYDEELLELTQHAFHLYACSYLIVHFNFFASSFYTALNDGVTSAIISLSRMLVFQIGAVLLLPLVLGLDGIWLAMTVAELITLFVAAYFTYRHRLPA